MYGELIPSIASFFFIALTDYIHRHYVHDVHNIWRYVIPILPTVEPTNVAILLGLFTDMYGFKPSVAGLAYLGLGIGFVIAAVIGAKFSNRIYAHVRFSTSLNPTDEVSASVN